MTGARGQVGAVPHPPVGPKISIEVPDDIGGLGRVRTRITAAASGWGFAAVGDLEVVLSELLTNAVLHGGTPSVATCKLLVPGFIEVAVNDSGSAAPRMGDPGERATSGRGLRIVEALSSAWGVEDVPDDGKIVWARLGTPA